MTPYISVTEEVILQVHFCEDHSANNSYNPVNVMLIIYRLINDLYTWSRKVAIWNTKIILINVT